MQTVHMRKVIVGGVLASISLVCASAWSHHAAAMFEPKKIITLDGVVKEFQWTNPHSWLQLMAADGKGGQVEWSLELGPSVGLSRAGWKPRVLMPGDKVEVSLHPLRDGSSGGRLVSVTLPGGQVLNGQGGAPPDARPAGDQATSATGG
jgi:hypothetical protein